MVDQFLINSEEYYRKTSLILVLSTLNFKVGQPHLDHAATKAEDLVGHEEEAHFLNTRGRQGDVLLLESG